MTISFSCPNCSKTVNANDRLAGKKSQCPQCKKVLQVPIPGAAAKRRKKVKKVKKVVKKKVKKVKKKVRKRPQEFSKPTTASDAIAKEPVVKTPGSNEKKEPVAKLKEEQPLKLPAEEQTKSPNVTAKKRKKKKVKRVVKKVKKKPQPAAEVPPPEEFKLAPDDNTPAIKPDPTAHAATPTPTEEFGLAPDDDAPALKPDATVPATTPIAPSPTPEPAAPTQPVSVPGLTEVPAPLEGLTPVDDALSAGLTPVLDDAADGLQPVDDFSSSGGDLSAGLTPVSNQPANQPSAPAAPATSSQPLGPMAPHRGVIWLIAGIILFLFGGSGFGCGCCRCQISGFAFLSWIQAFVAFLSFAGAVTCGIFAGLDLQKISARRMDPQGQVLTVIGLVLCIMAALAGAAGTCTNLVQAMSETVLESMYYAY